MTEASKQHNRDKNPGTLLVLYVDDDPSNHMALKAILSSRQDIEVLEALDEDDAVDLLEEQECLPDLVLMDQGLGHVTGAEVMELLTDKFGAALKFVICTGLSAQEARDLVEETGAAGFLCKPYTADAVLQMMQDVGL